MELKGGVGWKAQEWDRHGMAFRTDGRQVLDREKLA